MKKNTAPTLLIDNIYNCLLVIKYKIYIWISSGFRNDFLGGHWLWLLNCSYLDVDMYHLRSCVRLYLTRHALILLKTRKPLYIYCRIFSDVLMSRETRRIHGDVGLNVLPHDTRELCFKCLMLVSVRAHLLYS